MFPLMWNTMFYTHIKWKANLYFSILWSFIYRYQKRRQRNLTERQQAIPEFNLLFMSLISCFVPTFWKILLISKYWLLLWFFPAFCFHETWRVFTSITTFLLATNKFPCFPWPDKFFLRELMLEAYNSSWLRQFSFSPLWFDWTYLGIF
jgi:hypothetical protein